MTDLLLVEQGDRDAAADAMEKGYISPAGIINHVRSGRSDDNAFVQAFAAYRLTAERRAQPVTVASLYGYEAGLVEGARAQWEPIESAPAACHVLASRLDYDAGEWVYAVVESPPTHPFTHWMPLPSPPSIADGKEGAG